MEKIGSQPLTLEVIATPGVRRGKELERGTSGGCFPSPAGPCWALELAEPRALTPVVHTHAGQRSLPGLTTLGVRFRPARPAPRPPARLAPLRSPAGSITP